MHECVKLDTLLLLVHASKVLRHFIRGNKMLIMLDFLYYISSLENLVAYILVRYAKLDVVAYMTVRYVTLGKK